MPDAETETYPFDLNLLDINDIINVILDLNHSNNKTNIIIDFKGDIDFHMIVYSGWFFIRLDNNNKRQANFLASCKSSMTYYTGWRTVFAFYREKYMLGEKDFKVLKGLWDLIRCINAVEFESHHITFKRSFPMDLKTLCLNELKINRTKIDLPKEVQKRLGVQVSDECEENETEETE